MGTVPRKPAGISFAFACCAALCSTIPAARLTRGEETVKKPAEISIGIKSGDISGSDNRALQAAVDYVANLGGGVVHVGPGTYEMRNALFLRDGVHVKGTPGKTILAACDGAVSRLRLDGDCNERQVTLEDPAPFRVGDGISVQDERMGGGFGVTTATLTARIGEDTFTISNPLYYDYLVSKNATARLVFPLVAGSRIQNASLESVVIDGNRDKAQPLNGCRGGGVYLFECEGIGIRDCIVRGYNGDGVSFQLSHDVVVERCVCEGNAGIGLHPGSGSQRPVVRGNHSLKNGSDGMYVCWRVKHGVFEDNVIEQNGRDGVSIGHKDTDNLFRTNRILRNARWGLFFRSESEPMGAHRNTFEQNEILDNGLDQSDPVQVCIRGQTHDLVFRNNTIGLSAGKSAKGAAIDIGKGVEGLTLDANKFPGVAREKTLEE